MRLSSIIIYVGVAIASAATLFSCSDGTTFTAREKQLIGTDTSAAIMPLYTIEEPTEAEFLRKVAVPLTAKDVASDIYRVLRDRMLSTVTNPENQGVGIAAPQVGISRQLIAVVRFDKEGAPFEFYPNAEITFYSPEKKYGWEGCLSVPDNVIPCSALHLLLFHTMMKSLSNPVPIQFRGSRQEFSSTK